MKALGGFFPLEMPSLTGELPPRDAVLFQSGRSCLRAILEVLRPARLLAPFYVCDSAVAAAQETQTQVEYYPINTLLEPVLPPVKHGDAVMVVDYFGLCPVAASLLHDLGERLILDHTHAMFAGGHPSAWRFTSARKWFGVPDGGFAWGPQPLRTPEPREIHGVPWHLVQRRWGDPVAAYSAGPVRSQYD